MKTARYSLSLLAPVLLLVSGCTQHYIREGIWELSFQAYWSQTREPADIPPSEVRVRIATNAAGDGEEAEIVPLAAKSKGNPATPASEAGSPNQVRKPMYADLRLKREDEPVAVVIRHGESLWIWQMFGIVRDSETIAGTRLDARVRYKKVALEGTWAMRWLREE